MWIGSRTRVPFRYGGFYDVPRWIVFEWNHRVFILDSPFDEEQDEYPDEYSVYMAPESIKLGDDFQTIMSAKLNVLGKVPINGIGLDKTKRATLDAKFINDLVSGCGMVAPNS